MRQFYFFISIAVIFVSNVIVLPATADELKTIGTINGSQSYDSAEEIIFTPSILLAINLYDNDGLPNQWEMDNFGNMNQDPNGDEDNDGLTNLQEYTFGTDPNLSR
ncbi:MAG: hypothetical protein GY874_22140, partial [Desulfobacteraceae bacterium]|nr:hypothetical protein [Desulfobacteraceae bacterium]